METGMQVPLLDLKAEYLSLKDELMASIAEVFDGMRLYDGDNVIALETEFANFCAVKSSVGLGSGTEALCLALLACGVGPKDEVVTVSHTFIATIASIAFVGAKPVFVDIDPRSYTLDVTQIESAISPRTKAIIPVHLYGHPSDMDPIMELAKTYGIKVIEDACQAHGAEYKKRKVGSIGDVGCFSFVYTKILNAYGDAGLVTSNNDEIAMKVRLLHDHGRSGKTVHSILGLNCRLDEIHAATLRVKLRYLNDRLARRREIAEFYNDGLRSTAIEKPWERKDTKSAYWQYVIRTRHRDELATWLRSRGIESAVYYPVPCHLQKACRDLGYGLGSLPETEKCAREILSLPIYPELKSNQIEYVIMSIKDFDAQRRHS
jgi:dTDP-4-amino-4,6-dideoxygalactose transaminase